MSVRDDELLKIIGQATFCFWLDKDGEPCPKCGKLHNVLEKCDRCGVLYKPATGCTCIFSSE